MSFSSAATHRTSRLPKEPAPHPKPKPKTLTVPIGLSTRPSTSHLKRPSVSSTAAKPTTTTTTSRRPSTTAPTSTSTAPKPKPPVPSNPAPRRVASKIAVAPPRLKPDAKPKISTWRSSEPAADEFTNSSNLADILNAENTRDLDKKQGPGAAARRTTTFAGSQSRNAANTEYSKPLLKRASIYAGPVRVIKKAVPVHSSEPLRFESTASRPLSTAQRNLVATDSFFSQPTFTATPASQHPHSLHTLTEQSPTQENVPDSVIANTLPPPQTPTLKPPQRVALAFPPPSQPSPPPLTSSLHHPLLVPQPPQPAPASILSVPFRPPPSATKPSILHTPRRVVDKSRFGMDGGVSPALGGGSGVSSPAGRVGGGGTPRAVVGVTAVGGRVTGGSLLSRFSEQIDLSDEEEESEKGTQPCGSSLSIEKGAVVVGGIALPSRPMLPNPFDVLGIPQPLGVLQRGGGGGGGGGMKGVPDVFACMEADGVEKEQGKVGRTDEADAASENDWAREVDLTMDELDTADVEQAVEVEKNPFLKSPCVGAGRGPTEWEDNAVEPSEGASSSLPVVVPTLHDSSPSDDPDTTSTSFLWKRVSPRRSMPTASTTTSTTTAEYRGGIRAQSVSLAATPVPTHSVFSNTSETPTAIAPTPSTSTKTQQDLEDLERRFRGISSLLLRDSTSSRARVASGGATGSYEGASAEPASLRFNTVSETPQQWGRDRIRYEMEGLEREDLILRRMGGGDTEREEEDVSLDPHSIRAEIDVLAEEERRLEEEILRMGERL
ncbi:hypothetical protein HDU98_003209 [Podochytrium sp. JEL0797]|nr:hypothetical protein HDU98_003209 [Podochytrium sp. JEL0797]